MNIEEMNKEDLTDEDLIQWYNKANRDLIPRSEVLGKISEVKERYRRIQAESNEDVNLPYHLALENLRKEFLPFNNNEDEVNEED